MKRIFYILHWINLDTAVGAVVTSLFIAACLNTSIPPLAAVTLFLAVLSIYNFDHLMDARRVTKTAQSARHRFYQQQQRKLSMYQLTLMLGLIIIIWYLPIDILRAGLILALLTGIYFILLFFIFPRQFLFKEVMIAVVYALALFLAPVYSGPGVEIKQFWIILWLQILLIAVANTLIFAWYDHEMDLTDGHTSLAGSLGKTITYWLILATLMISIVLVIYQMLVTSEVYQQLVILTMLLVLLFSLWAKKLLLKKERYRVIGDAVFIIPAITFLI